ncbi:hypothetical protein GCM10029963_68560 [Micromonospora andamanensis]
MSTVDSRRLVQKLWNYCDVLRDDGVSTIDYVEQLTFLLFLKMADERANRSLRPERIVPDELSWQTLLDADGDALEVQYRHILEGLAKESGTLGTIFRKAQNKIQDPAKLKRLIVDLIDKERWSSAGVDVKGDAYEELLARGAEDTKSGAGQYFTPRALTAAMVDCVLPTPDDTITDPACGTGGFLLAAFDHIQRHHGASLTPDQRRRLGNGAISGTELVDGTARLAAMNMLLHGIGSPGGESLITVGDALGKPPSQRYSLVLANPPFGRSSTIRSVTESGRSSREEREIERTDFWAATANKQLNFVQHIASLLEIDGRAAVVLPDNVLFEGGAGRPSAAGCSSSMTCTPCCACPPASSTRAGSRPTCCSSSASVPAKNPGRRSSGCTTSAPTSTSRSSRTRCAASISRTSSTATCRARIGRSGWRPNTFAPSPTRS